MAENKTEKKLPEANFEVSSLAEVKDENGNGIFHLRTKTKFVLAISILILLAAGALIYLALENYFVAEIWQLAVWGLCGVLAIYSMFAKSIPTMLLNLVLFFGVSLIPVWQAGHETFKPVIEKFTQQPPQDTQAVEVEKVSETKADDAVKVEKEKNSAPVKTEKKSATVEVEKIPATNSETEKTVEVEKSAETSTVESQPVQENNSSMRDLPRI